MTPDPSEGSDDQPGMDHLTVRPENREGPSEGSDGYFPGDDTTFIARAALLGLAVILVDAAADIHPGFEPVEMIVTFVAGVIGGLILLWAVFWRD